MIYHKLFKYSDITIITCLNNTESTAYSLRILTEVWLRDMGNSYRGLKTLIFSLWASEGLDPLKLLLKYGLVVVFLWLDEGTE